MNTAFDRLQQALLTPNPQWAHRALQDELGQALQQADAMARVRLRMLWRLSYAAQRLDDAAAVPQTGLADLLVLLRQVIRSFGRALEIPLAWWQRTQYRLAEFGLYTSTHTDTTVTLHAAPWQPDWLPDTKIEDIEHLAVRRMQQMTVADGMLMAFSRGRMTSYRSEAQKVALDAVLHAPPGTTLLVTLPTGGGKSVCLLLPAWLASRGGQVQGGTSIVVVPTVSLALDQQNHVQEFFTDAVGATYQPYALTGDTPAETRAVIFQGIRDGTLPLLYTSPEALLNNPALHDAVLRAAEKGDLNWLVIDEAHMVEQWGAGFRTEFQLLAAFRRQLLDRSKGQLRTLLLSATVSAQCQQTLQEIFGNDGDIHTVFGNQLRPEISFWSTITRDVARRQEMVTEALHHLPRPAILYVTRPDDAEAWVEHLRQQGFARLAAYTGKTAALERTQIMRWWDRNDLDLMVATSAFGLGVDKEDVRTVIHATLPENVDRFYQEVGRGGRDGCRAISLVCCVPNDDFRLARSMSIRGRITVDKAYPRWNAMWQQRKSIPGTGSEFLLDLEAAPNYNPEMEPTDTHRAWNEHILLLMQRARLLTILDTNPQEANPTANGSNGDSAIAPQRRWLHIRLLESSVTYSAADFQQQFDPPRQEERRQLTSSLQQIRALVTTYSRSAAAPPLPGCLGRTFAQVYPNTALACGGCADCRSCGFPAGGAPIRVESDIEVVPPKVPLHSHVRARLFAVQPHHHVMWRGDAYPQTAVAQLLAHLLRSGFTQFILPADLTEDNAWTRSLLQELGQISPMRAHRILTDEMVVGRSAAQWTLYPAPTAVVYPTDSGLADRVYLRVKRECSCIPLVQVVQHSLYLPSEHGRFLDRANGLHMEISQFIETIETCLQTL